MTAAVKIYMFLYKSDQAAFKFLRNIFKKIKNNIGEIDLLEAMIICEIFLEYLKPDSHLPKKFILFALMKTL